MPSLGALARRWMPVGLCLVVPWVWWHYKLGAAAARASVNFWNADQFFYTVPAVAYARWMLRQGIVPLWNPYQLCGAPFLAVQLHGMLYPPHLLAAVLPMAAWARAMLVGHFALGMAGAWWCARIFGAARLAALLAGVAYALGGSLAGLGMTSMHPALVSAAWFPWQLGLTRALLRAERAWRWRAAALGATIALSFLGGHPQYVVMAAHLCGLYALLHALVLTWRTGFGVAAGRMLRFALAAAVAIGLAGVQLLPTAELMARSQRQPGALLAAAANDPFGYVTPRGILQSLLYPTFRPGGLPGEAHVGTAALALAVLPFFSGRYRARAAFLWLAATAAWGIALGNRFPLFRWYLCVPGASLFRIPQRYSVVAGLCLSLSGALGASSLARRRTARAVGACLAAAAALPAALWSIAYFAVAWTDYDARGSWALLRHGALFLGWGLLFALPGLRASRRWRHALLLLLAGATAWELYGAADLRWAVPATNPQALRLPVKAMQFLHERQGYSRLFAANSPSADFPRRIPLKVGMLAGLYSISDYENLFDYRYAQILDRFGLPRMPGSAHMGPFVERLGARETLFLRLLGVRFVLARRDVRLPIELPLVYRDAQYEAYEVPDPLPRVYVARAVRAAPSPQAALRAVLGDTEFLLDRGAIVEGPAPLGMQSGGGTAEIVRYRPHSVELRAELDRPSLVVLLDQFDPHWKVAIDGRAAEVVRANYIFRGVWVPAGTHQVRFAYHPLPVYAGAALTAGTLFALLAAGWATVRRSGAASGGGLAAEAAPAAPVPELNALGNQPGDAKE